LDYLNYLGKAYFVHKTQRQDLAGKKIFEVGEKYYFEDAGLRNSIAGYRPGDIQKILENVVFSHLQGLGYKVRVGVFGKREIDFVGEKQGERLYVQVCYLLQDQHTIDREFGNLMAIKDNFPKFVVSMDESIGKNSIQGIRHLHLREFLFMQELV
jgi:predicted AAA+ superfamily ATPase